MHKVFCIIGRTASGKSSIVQQISKMFNLKILKSYTTRDKRNEKDNDHIFIKQNEVEQYVDDMVAYTKRIGYCSFATSNQLFENDFYIINPQGYYDLKERIYEKKLDIELIPIYVECDINKLKDRAIQRGDYNLWNLNFEKEYNEFTEFENKFKGFRIDNTQSITKAVNELEQIITRLLKEEE